MPTYTYRCPDGHEWDEYRLSAGEHTQESQIFCPQCPKGEGRDPEEGVRGSKVPPSGVSARFIGRGWTPTHYPNRGGK